MVETSSKLQRFGATPGKLALIGVLAVVLGVVIYLRLGASSDDAIPSSATVAEPSRRRPAAIGGAAKASQQPAAAADATGEWRIATIDRRQWKAPELESVVRYDPFALPAAFPQPAVAGGGALTDPEGAIGTVDASFSEDQRVRDVAEIQAKLESLKQRGVRVIISGRNEAAAVIGDRTIHVGDDLEGFTVKAIEADGVVVERKLD